MEGRSECKPHTRSLLGPSSSPEEQQRAAVRAVAVRPPTHTVAPPPPPPLAPTGSIRSTVCMVVVHSV
jgi:hypothetical protein